MSEELKICSVSEYRNSLSAPIVIQVPSGQSFKIKRLSVMDYIKEGLTDIPNEFFAFINELASGVNALGKKDAEKHYALFEKFLTITIEKGIIEPPVTLKYDKSKEETHLIYSELSLDDQKYLIDVITGKTK